MPYLSSQEIKSLGIASIGANALIDSSVVFLGAENIEFGDNVRIDSFCLISAVMGNVHIGNNFHMASHGVINGGGGVRIGDYVGLSHKVTILSQSEDFSSVDPGGPWSATTRSLYRKQVTLEGRNLVGAHSVLLPGAALGFNSSLGAMSMLTKRLEAGNVASGVPAILLYTKTEE